MPGQTGAPAKAQVVQSKPSMEGRARARPNLSLAWWMGSRITCLQWRAGHVPGQTHGTHRPRPAHERPFNGGPGTCPAKRPDIDAHMSSQSSPSMEGRARARPNKIRASSLFRTACLQWRAGHVPGQTKPSGERPSPRHRPFNGGPGTCPAKQLIPVRRADHVTRPSMEGRARARPNWPAYWAAYKRAKHLQWRAGHVPGQTRPGRRRRHREPAFNGGPGTCPAKPPRRRSPSRRPRPFNGGPGTCPAKPLACFGGYDLLVRGHLRAVWEV